MSLHLKYCVLLVSTHLKDFPWTREFHSHSRNGKSRDKYNQNIWGIGSSLWSMVNPNHGIYDSVMNTGRDGFKRKSQTNSCKQDKIARCVTSVSRGNRFLSTSRWWGNNESGQLPSGVTSQELLVGHRVKQMDLWLVYQGSSYVQVSHCKVKQDLKYFSIKHYWIIQTK